MAYSAKFNSPKYTSVSKTAATVPINAQENSYFNVVLIKDALLLSKFKDLIRPCHACGLAHKLATNTYDCNNVTSPKASTPNAFSEIATAKKFNNEESKLLLNKTVTCLNSFKNKLVFSRWMDNI